MKGFVVLALTSLLVVSLGCGSDCQMCDTNTNTCYSCRSSGSLPLEDGNCAANRKSTEGCLIYSLGGECKRCSLTYRLDPATHTCKKDLTGCLSASTANGQCLRCGFGTKLENGHCTGILNCQNYDQRNPRICKQCYAGFDSFDVACMVTEGCMTTLDNGGCSECSPQLVLNGFACYSPGILLPGCAILNGKGGCLYCEDGLILQNDKCSVPAGSQASSGSSVTVLAAVTPLPTATLITTTPLIASAPSVEKLPQVAPVPSSPQPVYKTPSQPSVSQLQKSKGAAIDKSTIEITLQPPTASLPQLPAQDAPKDDPCRAYDGQSKVCLACNYGYYLSAGACVAVSKLCDGYDLLNGNCLGCISGYRLSQNGECLQDLKQDPNCKILADGQCINCNYGFILKNGICAAVNPLCQGYDLSNGKCLGCPPNYTLRDGDCIDTKTLLLPTPALQTQPITTPSLTQSPVPNIVVPVAIPSLVSQPQTPQPLITQPTPILTAAPPLLAAPSAATSFPQTTTPTQPQQTAAKDPKCRTFDKEGTCTECYKGYLLTAAKKCAMINQLCAEIDLKDGSCTKCYNGYKLDHGKCVVKLADPNCRKLVDNICKECSSGFYLNKDNKCSQFNPQCATSDPSNGDCLTCYTGYSLKAGRCYINNQDPNCKTFQGGVCTACASGYYTNNGKCVQASPLCASFEPNNGNCLSCYHGYTLSAGTCIVGVADPNCKEYKNGQCSKCSSGYVLKQGKCSIVSPLCAQFDPNTGDCTACYTGYSLNAGRCEVSNSDPNCKSFQNGACTACSNGFFLSNSKKCIVINPLCRKSSEEGKCTACYPGYLLTTTGECIVPTNSDPNCAQKSGSSCLYCKDRFYLDNGTCTAVNPQCFNYDMGTGRCLSCYTGYFASNGQCLESTKSSDTNCETLDENQKCIKCRQGYYADKADGKCKAVSLLCETFDYNQGKCTACASGYVLQDNDCIYPSMGIDEHCTHYTNSYCDSCQQGWSLISYQCIQDAPK